MTQSAPYEFSRPLTVGHIPAAGVDQTIEAKPAERTALAERFELIAIDRLSASLTAVPGRLHSVTVTGTIEATLTQRCVVTLEPLPASLTVPVDTVFLPADARPDEAGPAEGADLDEDVEFYEHGRIDLGELVAQQLAISIDPYPRKPGATVAIPDRPIDRLAADAVKRPALAGLAQLKDIVGGVANSDEENPAKPPRKG